MSVSSAKIIEDVKEAINESDLSYVLDTLQAIKVSSNNYKPRIKQSIKIVKGIVKTLGSINSTMNDLKEEVQKNTVNIESADEVNITAAKSVKRVKRKTDANKKQSDKLVKWNQFRKMMRDKPKYKDLPYKDFLKIASEKYKNYSDYESIPLAYESM